MIRFYQILRKSQTYFRKKKLSQSISIGVGKETASMILAKFKTKKKKKKRMPSKRQIWVVRPV